MLGKKVYVLAICIALALGGFSQITQAQEKEVYAINVAVSHLPVWSDARDAQKVIEKVYGVKVIYGGPTSLDVAEQTADIDTLIAEEVAGIILYPADPVALAPAINRAVEAGIPVVTFFSDVPNSKRLVTITVSYEKTAEIQAEIIAKLLGYKGKVVVSLSSVGQLTEEWRLQGYKTVIGKYPDMELVGIVQDAFDPGIGAREIKPLLVLHPDIKAIMGTNSRSGIGAVMALRESGYKPGEVLVLACDYDEDTLDLIKEGWIQVSNANRNSYVTALAFSVLYQYNHGRNGLIYPKAMPWEKYGVHGIGEKIEIPLVVITKENVDAFYRVE